LTIHTITTDRFQMWRVDESDGIWTVAEDATLAVYGRPAIGVKAGNDGNQIDILGDILNSGYNSYGVVLMGKNNTITFGENSEVHAASGVYGAGEDNVIVNHGDIDATFYGLYVIASCEIENTGDITGSYGVLSGGGIVTNSATGRIFGGYVGVGMYGEDGELVNRGLIEAGETAVISDIAALTLRNRGVIHGLIRLGGGNDIFDNRDGLLKGVALGGGGDDLFILTDKTTMLAEGVGNGTDTVMSSVSHVLEANVERLILSGGDDVNATGNALDNAITGNEGANLLSGRKGADVLKGGAGDDTATGGDGSDTFAFFRGDDVDHITDFDNAGDRIGIYGFSGIQAFTDLGGRISKQGADVWIDLGKGDLIVVENRLVGDIEETDFSFSLV
jgi:Ca2+-binding RTX toxin-like protein